MPAPWADGGSAPAIERAAAIATLTRVELAKPARTAVAGFDLTFAAPKSASTVWALADARTQEAVVAAHRAAVDDALAHLEATALVAACMRSTPA